VQTRVSSAAIDIDWRFLATTTSRSLSPTNPLIVATPTRSPRISSEFFPSLVCRIVTTNLASFADLLSLLIEFFLGAFDWFHLPIPIWIQVESIAGTVRLRCQMIQEFPYVRNVSRILLQGLVREESLTRYCGHTAHVRSLWSTSC
jgi:hypothetical protein